MDDTTEASVNYTTIRVRENRGIFYLQLNRPEAKNSINEVLIDEMLDAFAKIEAVEEIKVIVLEGLPDDFCSEWILKL